VLLRLPVLDLLKTPTESAITNLRMSLQLCWQYCSNNILHVENLHDEKVKSLLILEINVFCARIMCITIYFILFITSTGSTMQYLTVDHVNFRNHAFV